jgi:hydroxymethylbilane synthase
MTDTIILGTRGSELALAQTRMVAAALQERWSDVEIKTNIIRTSGDEDMTELIVPRAGRKGLFTAEIERALREGEINVAVHSAKDLPSELHPETHIAAALPRASVDDLLVALQPYNLQSLPANAVVATGSVRRKYQLQWKRPDLSIVDLRGNVPTRLRKLAGSEWQAIVLAAAGLDRLGARGEHGVVRYQDYRFAAHPLPRELFVPAGGQGVIALQIRTGDDRVRMLLEEINHFDTRLALRAEREFLRLLQGDCNQPVGVFAATKGARMTLRAQVFDEGSSAPREAVLEGASEDAEILAELVFAAIHGK